MALPANPNLKLRDAVLGWWREQCRQNGLSKSLLALLSELWGFVRDSTPEQRRRRYGDIEFDWDHRVDTTSATVGWRDRLLGIFHSPYQPTEPVLFHEMLQVLAIDFSGFTFIDLGSGKGRTLLMAAEYPFRRIIGVELLPRLHRVASENVRKYARERRKCFVVEARCGDAKQFKFPDEPLVLYLFNPLSEAGLAVVIRNLETSLREHPRGVLLLYHNPLLEHLLSESSVLRRVSGTHQYSVYASEPIG